MCSSDLSARGVLRRCVWRDRGAASDWPVGRSGVHDGVVACLVGPSTSLFGRCGHVRLPSATQDGLGPVGSSASGATVADIVFPRTM